MASVNASHDDDDDAAVDSINITPLVDVLMVVLVMFILTATAQVSGIQIHLPKASASVSLSEAKTKAISVKTAARCSSMPTRSPSASWRSACASRKR